MEKSNFEYIDADSIDEELKCAICFRPFHCPVYNSKCGHTFCEECTQNWHKNSSVCPSCRQRVNIKDYKLVQTRIVLNQLSRLHSKCNLCQQINIDDRKKHMEICPKQIIKCTSADIQCQWKGQREDFQLHLETCSFHRIRPIINQLIQEIQLLKQTQSIQNHFIKAFINNGYTLTNNCSISNCFLLNEQIIEHKPGLMSCSLCNEEIDKRHIALHSCITINCICKSCLEKCINEPFQTSSSPLLTLKRKLSSTEENDYNLYGNRSRSRSPLPRRARSRSRSRSPF